MGKNALLSQSQIHTANHEHNQSCLCSCSVEARQQLVLKERAFKMLQMQNIYLQNMLNMERAKQSQSLWSRNLPSSFGNIEMPLTLPFNFLHNPYGKINPDTEAELCEISELEFTQSPQLEILEDNKKLQAELLIYKKEVERLNKENEKTSGLSKKIRMNTTMNMITA